jgi:hypothetical protein
MKMTKTLYVTEAEPQVLEVLDDAELDAVSGGLTVFAFLGANSALNAIGNNNGSASLVSIGFLNVDV